LPIGRIRIAIGGPVIGPALDRQIFYPEKGRPAFSNRPAKISSQKKAFRMEHRIDLTPARRQDDHGRWRGHGAAFASYLGKVIGEFKHPLCQSARWLLDNGRAEPSDRISTFRDGVPALSGNVGAMAKLTVRENEKLSPHFVKWEPMPDSAVGVESDVGSEALQMAA
jgi:hypothetical protein